MLRVRLDLTAARPRRAGRQLFGRNNCLAAPLRKIPLCPEWRIANRDPAVKLLLVVAAALIDADDRVLIAQRPKGKRLADLWEFPGGKIDAGERPEEALIRELAEELGIIVKEACLAPLTFASHAYEDFHLLMPLYVCRRWEGFVTAREAQALKWVRAKDLRNYPMPPADIPLIPHLIDVLM